jgi:hypothetical protein
MASRSRPLRRSELIRDGGDWRRGVRARRDDDTAGDYDLPDEETLRISRSFQAIFMIPVRS